MAQLYTRWMRSMDKKSFAHSIRPTVPEMDGMILVSAETTGRLAEGLRFLARAVNITNKMSSTIKKAIMTPIMLILMMMGVLSAFALFMVPTLSTIYKPDLWPFMGKVVFYMSRTTLIGGPFILLGVGIVAFFFSYSLPRWTGSMRSRCDKHLPFSVYRDYMSGIFLVTLASLMQAGVSLTEALQKIRETASPWMRSHINVMLKRLDKEPDRPARALDTGMFTRALADRIADFGERSNFREAISKVGLQGVDKVMSVVETSSNVMNKVLLLVVGVTIGILIAGTMQTSFGADEALKAQTRKYQR
jgi:type II secretory pathway component PulF